MASSATYKSVPMNNFEKHEVTVEKSYAYNWKKIFASFAMALSVSVSWACGRQFTKSALDLNPKHFYAPYFLVWFNTCFMIVCYPVFLLFNYLANGQSLNQSNKKAEKIYGADGFTAKTVLSRTVPFILLWIAANYAYSQALGYISASSALVIASTNVVMVCLFECIMLNEKFAVLKIISAVFAFGGVIIMSIDKEFTGQLLGVCLILLCAVMAAFYKVLFKVFNKNADLGQTSLFMSALGLINLIFNIIPTALLIYYDLDHIEWDYIPWSPLILAGVLTLIFNFLLNFGIALLGPFAISVGTLMGIPISATIDVIFRNMQISCNFLVGSLAIAFSFIIIAFPLTRLCSKPTI